MINVIPTFLICFCTSSMECKEKPFSRSSDFMTVSKSRHFVDKTSFIAEFLKPGPPVKVITAPNRFGKSTIVDMVRRFASLRVNKKGIPIDPKNGTNYKLFCEKPLEICKDNEEFIDKYLGRHPVIVVDFSPLRAAYDIKSFMRGMRTVMWLTYIQHSYLLKVELPKSCKLHKSGLRKRMNPDTPLNRKQIKSGIIMLAEALHDFFDRNVIILLDDYDAHYSAILLRNVTSSKEIVHYLSSMNELLFRYNEHLERGLLTGVLRIESVRESFKGNKFEEYRFLGNHEFSSYYGFTRQEVRKLLADVRPGNVADVENVLEKHYGGYQVQNKNITLYNPFSLIWCLTKNVSAKNYWVRTQYLASVTESYRIKNISDIIQNLLIGGSVEVDMDYPFTNNEIRMLKIINKSLDVKHELEIGLVFRFLYDIGFLTPELGDSHDPVKNAKIPNVEIQLEFGRLLAKDYTSGYYFRREDMEIYQESLNGFVPEEKHADAFKFFRLAVHNLFHNSYSYPFSGHDVQSILLAFAAEKFELGQTRTLAYSTATEAPTNITGRIEIVAANRHNMAIIIDTKFKSKITKENKLISDGLGLAKIAHDHLLVTHRSLVDNVDSLLRTKPLKGAVYIGIGFMESKRNITIVGSTVLFKTNSKCDYNNTYIY